MRVGSRRRRAVGALVDLADQTSTRSDVVDYYVTFLLDGLGPWVER